MITTFLLNLVYSVASGFLNLFPTTSISDDVLNSIQTANTYIAGLNIILSVYTILTILGLTLTIEGVILTIKIINWFIRKIPTIN
jgi:hypothetical protein